MAGFNWNEFYTVFKVKLEKAVKCTVGRYVTPKESQFPYVDVAIGDNSGRGYNLQGGEGAQLPMIVIDVYCTGSLADSTCEKISNKAKEIMLSYGFRCRSGPIPAASTGSDISRWTTRYQRIFGAGDDLKEIQ